MIYLPSFIRPFQALALALLVCGSAACGQTVVFNPGLGDDAKSFAAVARKVKRAATFNTARPARIKGDEDGKRSPVDAARDLHSRLKASGKPPPYILVGHSVGGAYALAFANLYPAETKALILVDPRLPAFERACRAAGQTLCAPPAWLRRLMPRAQLREVDGLGQGPARYVDFSTLGAMQVTVFAATKPQTGMRPDWQALWVSVLQRETAKARNGRFIAVPSSHYIHRHAAFAVRKAIQSAVDAP